MNWETVQQHLRTRYKLSRETAALVELSFTCVPGQPVVGERVQCVRAFDQTFVLVTCDVFEVHAMAAGAALAHNLLLAVGALALQGDRYVLRHALPIQGLDLTELEACMERVARETTRLRQRQGGTRKSGTVDVFHAYAS